LWTVASSTQSPSGASHGRSLHLQSLRADHETVALPLSTAASALDVQYVELAGQVAERERSVAGRRKAAHLSASGLVDPTLGYPARGPASWRRRSEFRKFLPDSGRLLGKSGAIVDFVPCGN